jgi:anti-repressor protein
VLAETAENAARSFSVNYRAFVPLFFCALKIASFLAYVHGRLCSLQAISRTGFRGWWNTVLSSESTGGRPSIEHALSIDMAKEIAMVQRSEKGQTIRRYFIEVERRWRTSDNVPTVINADFLERVMLRMRELEQENAKMLPKAEYFDTLVDRALLTNFRDTAKELHIRECTFIDTLLQRGYLYRDAKGNLKPYAEPLHNGLFELKEWAARFSDKTGNQTLVTPKGRETFRLLFSVPRSVPVKPVVRVVHR